ncbi:hypothetical protein HKX48_001869, partial [Thoreauomyces humboldtii]
RDVDIRSSGSTLQPLASHSTSHKLDTPGSSTPKTSTSRRAKYSNSATLDTRPPLRLPTASPTLRDRRPPTTPSRPSPQTLRVRDVPYTIIDHKTPDSRRRKYIDVIS